MACDNIGQLIQELQKFDPRLPVGILDGFNGGGEVRRINLGPFVEIRADHEDLGLPTGERQVVVLGYGCY